LWHPSISNDIKKIAEDSISNKMGFVVSIYFQPCLQTAKKNTVLDNSFKPGTLLALMPKEPIDCFAKVLPCSAASAAVFSETVLAGASSAGEG